MPEDNVAVVRKGLEALNRGDFAGMVETIAPDAELVPLKGVLEGVSYEGEQGLRRFMREMDEEWAEFQIDVRELRAIEDSVLVLGNFHVRGRASGMEVNVPAAWVCAMAGGKVRRIQAYTRPEEALHALGVEG